VNDYADLLDDREEQFLERKLVAYDDSTSTQIAIVIIPSIEDDDMFDYSQRLAESWGIGGKENSNGILVLVAQKERKIRIHTGYGVEGAIPDAIASRILRNEITPAFKEGQYYVGLNQATSAMMQALASEYEATGEGSGPRPIAFIPIVLIGLILLFFFRRRSYTGYSRSGRHFYGTPWVGGGFGGGGSGFGGGGGGFGGFGGGSFGGGGAGGSW